MATVLIEKTREEVSDSVTESLQAFLDDRGISDTTLLDDMVQAAIGGFEMAGIQFKRSGWVTYDGGLW